jgi:hypothetical protein
MAPIQKMCSMLHLCNQGIHCTAHQILLGMSELGRTYSIYGGDGKSIDSISENIWEGKYKKIISRV